MREITIIGGGLSGLTLGIALRREGVPVTIWEAGEYPRHRVCGEFISGRGLQTLSRLGLSTGLSAAGARAARTVSFYTGGRRILRRRLPQEAVCISRDVLDTTLAEQFRREGGQLLIKSRWHPAKEGFPEGVVRASGRQPELQSDGRRWYGLKAHANNVALATDLEMHFERECYIGLCRLAGERVNVCGLFRDAGDHSRKRFDALRGDQAGELNLRLADATWDNDSFCAVAGLPPYPRLAAGACIGDALAMPAPLTGNGMSMAFESAELASGPLVAYATGALEWQETVLRMQKEFRRAFGKRLWWSSFLHRVLFRPRADVWGFLAPLCWRTLFAATR